MKPHFPKTHSEEFLLVDFVDNMDRLAEPNPSLLEGVKKRASHADAKLLARAVREYGRAKTRKFFQPLLAEGTRAHAR